MRNTRFILALFLAIAFGIAAGYFYRRWKSPTLEERTQDAAEDLKRGVEKLLK
jgi:hypothetical protein